MHQETKRGATGRGRGRGRGAGRGKRGRRAALVVSSDEETLPETPVIEAEPPKPTAVEAVIPEPVLPMETTAVIEPEALQLENIPPTIDIEADISQLEAPTFTTITRGPPEPMLRLKWTHKVLLIGEKVLNPMIHSCDTCLLPILHYGRMIPCKHVFCLMCAKREPFKECPRCKEKVCRVEQSGLGSVFMCTHGGSRYNNKGCRRTYLSQRDLQAHINHRHVAVAASASASTVAANLNANSNTGTVTDNNKSSTNTPSSGQRKSLGNTTPNAPSNNAQPNSMMMSSVRTNLINMHENHINSSHGDHQDGQNQHQNQNQHQQHFQQRQHRYSHNNNNNHNHYDHSGNNNNSNSWSNNSYR